MIRWRRAAALVPIVTTLIAGCGDGGSRGVPLVGDPVALEVLVETAEIALPPSDAPQRFGGGWIPERLGGRRAFRAAPVGAVLHVVTTVPRERRLVLDLADDPHRARPDRIVVRLDDAAPAVVPVTDPLAIPLPAAPPAGRHRVELSPAAASDPPLLVERARMRTALAGAVEIRPDEVVQTGPSIVEIVGRPPPGATPTGELCVTRAGREGDGFRVVEERPDRSSRRWSHLSGRRALPLCLGGWQRFELPDRPVGGEDPAATAAGPVRVRLTVGAGSEGRWRRLAWTGGGAGRGAPAGPPTPAPAFRPPRLVLVYLFDALRADHVGHLGGPEGVSPTVDRLAAEGAAFLEHRTNAPNTLPSIRELFTGRVYLTPAAWRRVGAERPTVAELFRRAGYRTGLFSGNGYVSESPGLARGFDHVSREALYQVGPGEEGRGASAAVNRNAERVHRAALRWLDELAAEGWDGPVFLYLQTIHPHNPFAPPPAFAERFAAGIPSEIEGSTEVLKAIERGERSTTEADRRRLAALYAASMAYNDAELGRFLAAVAERHPPAETLGVFSSDHGEELFDHGGVLHGYTLYEELLRVPLVVWAPGRVAPRTVAAPTDVLDLHATLAELAERAGAGDLGPPPPSEGRSLLPLLAGVPEAGLDPEAPRFAATWGVPGGIHAVRAGRWKLIRVGGTPRAWWMGRGPGRSWEREYLFDLAEDPGEERNLAGRPEHAVREQWLRSLLDRWVARQHAMDGGKSGSGGEDDDLPADAAARERLRALGYLE